MLNHLPRTAVLGALTLSSLIAACSETTETSGSGGSTSTDPGCPMTTSSGGSASPIDLCEAGPLPESPCTPTDAECKASASRCLALIDQSQSPVFGLRMSQLTIAKPDALASGHLWGTIIGGFVQPDRAACRLSGSGSLSWLLEFDLGAGTLKTGGAFPPADPQAGYAFQDTMIPTFGVPQHVAPVTLSLTSSPPCAFSTSAADLVIPMYTAVNGSKVVLVPLHQVRFHGQISTDHACIGAFDPKGLEETCCWPDSIHPPFREGGSIEGFFILEEADTFDAGIDESLCVMLSPDADMFADGPQAPRHCKRDAQGHIVLKGDWCSATNQPATPDCADAMRFSATFAASGVAITH